MKKINQIFCLFYKRISPINLWRKSFLLLLLSSFIIVFANGCKDEDELGSSLLPSADQLYTSFSDTTTVNSSTQSEDSLRTDELSYQLLGSDDDPVFGVSVASVYTNVNLEGTPTFGFQPVADSLILYLSYAGYYGDTAASQTLNVYSLTEDLHIDSTYYSSKTFTSDPNPIGSLSYKPRPKTKVILGSDTLSPHLRITLSKTLADSIIALNGKTELSSNANWLAYFKGLYLATLPVNYPGAISYFNFFNSKLTLYFHDSSLISKNYNFSLTGARINNFTHNYTATPVGNQLADSSIGDSVNYIQAMAGVKTKISFPFLKHFLDSGSILLNRAELKITTGELILPYNPPAKIFLVTKNESGEMVFPIDYFESADLYGGSLNATSDGYTFNIARHLQRYLNGTISNADFYLIISGSGVEANRVIIKSGSNSNTKMKLSLFYTKLY